jgi:hypothetical protein
MRWMRGEVTRGSENEEKELEKAKPEAPEF